MTREAHNAGAAARMRKFRAAHPEQNRETYRRYKAKHADRLRAKQRDRQRALKAADPEYGKKKYAREWATSADKIRKRTRRSRGLPEPTRPEPAVCEICGAAQTGRWKSLCVDHDHDTNAFRGWICHQCNRGIGLLGDSLETVKLVVRYLEKAKAAETLAKK